jgi:hypothetical protein
MAFRGVGGWDGITVHHEALDLRPDCDADCDATGLFLADFMVVHRFLRQLPFATNALCRNKLE